MSRPHKAAQLLKKLSIFLQCKRVHELKFKFKKMDPSYFLLSHFYLYYLFECIENNFLNFVVFIKIRCGNVQPEKIR